MKKYVLSLTFLVAACAQDKSEPLGQQPAPVVAPARAEATLRAGGTWSFSLDDSPTVAARFRETCKAEANADACYAKIRAVGARESIGFETDEKGQLFWISRDDEGALLHRLPVKIVQASNDVVVVTPAGADSAPGEQAPIPAGVQLTIEVTPEGNVVMSDPQKGRLYFKPKR